MTPDEPVENPGAHAEPGESTSSPSSSTGGSPRPPGDRGGRFRRGGRGGRGRRSGGGGGRRQEQRPPPEHPEPASAGPPGTVRQAIELAGQIQSELERALEDVNEILKILDQAERERNTSEEELDHLRESLHRLQHGRGPARPSRFGRPAPAVQPAPSPESEPHEPETESEPETARESAPDEEGDERS